MDRKAILERKAHRVFLDLLVFKVSRDRLDNQALPVLRGLQVLKVRKVLRASPVRKAHEDSPERALSVSKVRRVSRVPKARLVCPGLWAPAELRVCPVLPAPKATPACKVCLECPAQWGHKAL